MSEKLESFSGSMPELILPELVLPPEAYIVKRELILLFGPAGTGKSYCLLTIARALPHRRFFILDTDMDYYAMLDQENLPNVVSLAAASWEQLIASMQWVKKVARPGDWLVPDMLDTTWDQVQSYYVDQVFHEDLGDFYLKVRKDMKDGQKSLEAFDGWTDWGVVNSLYASFWNSMLATPCHIFAMAKGRELAKKNEDKLTAVLGQPHGAKPDGQKRTSHRFHSIMITGVQNHPTEPGRLQWFITTYRERWKRPYLTRLVISNFFLEYGVARAGWGTPTSTVF